MAYRHIFWDFDGTLFDTYPITGQAFYDVLRDEYGIKENIKEIIAFMQVSMDCAFEHYKQKYRIGDNFFEKYKLLSGKYVYELAKPFPNIQNLCSAICKQNKYNYLYTHRSNTAFALLEKYNMYDEFTYIVTRENGFEPKPSPQALEFMITKHFINISEALMIGDREIDVLAAKNAGISACLFTEETTINSKADYIIKDLKELYSIIGLLQM